MIRLNKTTFIKDSATRSKLAKFITSNEILSMNKKCTEFERKFSVWQSRKYSVLFNSGSSANLALLQAFKNLKWIRKGDKVGFSSLTWATNIMPIIQTGFIPLPIDVSKRTLNIRLDDIEDKKIDALFITNALGLSDNISEIRDYCNSKNILFFEDNCESMGSVYDGEKLGNFGVASTFSFYVGHQMSTIEGGMICTDNKALYDMLLMVRCHGWTRCLDEESRNHYMIKNNVEPFFDKYTFYCEAYNLRPMEITGFLGIEQLKYIDSAIKKRHDNFMYLYNKTINNYDIVHLDIGGLDLISSLSFPLVCKDRPLFNKYRERAENANIEIRPIIGGDVTRQPFYPFKANTDSNAQSIFMNGLYLPNNESLTKSELEKIGDVIGS